MIKMSENKRQLVTSFRPVMQIFRKVTPGQVY